ncbi:MAG: cytochrome C [Proteobacteria bacterium]|nr:MAG: cytochrome C [Pseudomonadota bacterium]PIE40465.1 MAG: cytochrome C [Gammaproteobacteria bacterium]
MPSEDDTIKSIKKMQLRVMLVSGVAGLGLVAILGWVVIDTGLHVTGDYEFCTSCHNTMAPMAIAYKNDLHGGKNPAGWRARCVDCHLPHDNALHHLFVKARHGIVDSYMEWTTEPLDIDWHGNRKNRESFVYDSGCLSCHKYLADASRANRKAFHLHRVYFARNSGMQCVSCHQHVGHHELGDQLLKLGWEAAR